MDAKEISSSLINAAEECFETRDFEGAMELMEQLIMLPNSSENHALYLRYYAAYSVHSYVSQQRTYYEILGISNPFCSSEAITRRYIHVSDKFDRKLNPSVSAKTASKLVYVAWQVLSDPSRRRAYDVKLGLRDDAAMVTQRRKRRR